jgi:hypothetical protein
MGFDTNARTSNTQRTPQEHRRRGFMLAVVTLGTAIVMVLL